MIESRNATFARSHSIDVAGHVQTFLAPHLGVRMHGIKVGSSLHRTSS